MDTEELGEKLKGWFSKGAKVSKEAFEKAGDKVQEFSDKSVIRIEKKQLESKLEKKYEEVGEKVVALLEAEAISIKNKDDKVVFKAFLEEINKIKDEIKAKEELL